MGKGRPFFGLQTSAFFLAGGFGNVALLLWPWLSPRLLSSAPVPEDAVKDKMAKLFHPTTFLLLGIAFEVVGAAAAGGLAGANERQAINSVAGTILFGATGAAFLVGSAILWAGRTPSR